MSTKITQIFQSNLTWKTLAYFLSFPTTEVYVKELARRFKAGPTGLNNALCGLKKIGLLKRQKRGRAHFYSLNNESGIVKPLKVAYFLARFADVGLVDKLLELDEGLISLCIYGSYANGTFDERSDLDILIISQRKKSLFNSILPEAEGLLKVEINIEIFSLANWKCLKEKDKTFYQEVVASHILLYGSQI